MELPSPTTIQGAFDYLIMLILLLALICGVYFAALYAGITPGL